jgi:hypothetical protein
MDRDLTMQILPLLVDGFTGKMQMYLWGASPFGEFLDVIEPTSNTDLLGTYASTRFPFIPIPREEDDSINSALVLVEDEASWVSTPLPGVPAPSPDTRMDVQLIQLQECGCS